MSVRFERQTLYEQVWSTPLSKLAPTHGLSDNGLRKICKALNVPLPGIGYWAKLAAGHKVRRTSLPARAERTVFVSYPPSRTEAPSRDPTDSEWLRQKIAEEMSASNRITVAREPAAWHPCLSRIRKDLHAAVAQHARDIKARRLYEERKLTDLKHAIHLSPMDWQYLDRGEILVKAQFASFLRVSPLTCDRALALANAMLLGAKDRGIRVAIDTDVRRFAFTLEQQTFHVAIRERQSFIMKKPRPGWEMLGEQRQYQPTDTLAIVAERSGASSFEIKDGVKVRVEDQINNFFTRLYRGIVTSRENARRVALEAQRSAEAAHARIARAEVAEHARQAREVEMKQFEELRREATEWDEVQRIRSYAGAVASSPAACRSDETNEWIRWSLEKADELDPVRRRLAG